MARHATIAAAQTEAAILAIGTAETACEGRLYPTNDTTPQKVYIGMADGSIVGPLPGSGTGGGGEEENSTTLSASGETSLEIRYFGDTAPTLTKEAAGEYRLDLATGTSRVSFVWRGASASETTAGSVKLKIRDADGEYRHPIVQVFSDTNGDMYTHLESVRQKQTEPASGDTLLEVRNIGNVSAPWRLNGIIT